MWIIVFLICCQLFVFIFALIKMGDKEINEVQSTAALKDMSDTDEIVKTAVKGMIMVDALHRLDKWSKEKKKRDYYAFRWQEKVRDENPSFKEHYDYDF